MKKRTRTLRRDLLSKAATISLVAVSLAGCSGAVERFGSPADYYTSNTSNQRDIINGAPAQPSYEDIANGPGGTVAGLPQDSSAPAATGSISRKSSIQSAPLPAPGKTAAAPARTTPVATAPAPEVSGSSRGSNWRGWTAAGGTQVKVRQGDSLNTVARRYGVPVQALASVNGIGDPNAIRPGQTLIVPTYVYADNNGYSSATEGETGRVKLPSSGRNSTIVTGSVPVQSQSTPSPDRKPAGQPSFAEISTGTAKVANVKLAKVDVRPKRKPGGAGQSLTTASIAPASDENVPSPRRQPSGKTAAAPAVTAAPSGNVVKNGLPEPAKTNEARPTEPIKTPAIVASVQPDTDAATESFRWPVRGRIISDFGAKPGGGRNEGVNLAVPEGTPVKAADSGTVIYAGNELKGYGNLILLRHSEGWVTAYAHNSELKVKRGDKVRRGDVISLAGATGSVTQPQVHFELRQGNKPVDPLNHLPKR